MYNWFMFTSVEYSGIRQKIFRPKNYILNLDIHILINIE